MPSDATTPYEEIRRALELLHLPTLVTKEEIKRQYRYLAKQYHPDKGGDASKMCRLTHAYETLMEYIDNFRYRFDEEEIRTQYPGVEHATRFTP